MKLVVLSLLALLVLGCDEPEKNPSVVDLKEDFLSKVNGIYKAPYQDDQKFKFYSSGRVEIANSHGDCPSIKNGQLVSFKSSGSFANVNGKEYKKSYEMTIEWDSITLDEAAFVPPTSSWDTTRQQCLVRLAQSTRENYPDKDWAQVYSYDYALIEVSPRHLHENNEKYFEANYVRWGWDAASIEGMNK